MGHRGRQSHPPGKYHITPGRIEGKGRRGLPEIADYVLVYRNLKLAVNEAKAWDKAVMEGATRLNSVFLSAIGRPTTA